MRFLIIILCQIACIVSQDFQFATYTSTEAVSQPTGLTQNIPTIDSGLTNSNGASQDTLNGGVAIDALSSGEVAQIPSNATGLISQGTADTPCTPGVLIGTFNLVGSFTQ
jgi:hypothetical protein